MACLSTCHLTKRLCAQNLQTFSRMMSSLQSLHCWTQRHQIPSTDNTLCGFLCSVWHRTLPGAASLRFGAISRSGNLCRHLSQQLPDPSSFSRHVWSRTVHASSQLAAGQIGFGGDSERSQRDSESRPKSRVSESAWAVRLANENGFLSWCRNTYLTTVVGIAMLGEGTTAMAQHAAEGAFFVAGINLTWGTYHFVYNILYLRRQIGMTILGALLQVSMAIAHLVLWFMICILYIGYTDSEVEAMRDQLEEDRKSNV